MNTVISVELIQSVKKEEEAVNKALLELLLIRSRTKLEERAELEEIIVDFYHQNLHLITLVNQEAYEKVLGNKLICDLVAAQVTQNLD